MDESEVADLSGGANQARVRAHNERLVLSLVRRHDGLSKAEIARRSGLSAQTVTMIMRALEADGLLLKGEPKRGKVGQPSIPMSLNPEGAYSYGLKIGRRSVDLVLTDFTGQIRGRVMQTYTYPHPDHIRDFVKKGVGELIAQCPNADRSRIAGLGVAMPFELWNWADKLEVPREDMAIWRDVDIVETFGAATGLPVLVQNDCSAACGAELMFGSGRRSANYAYFFLGYFIGGGIVLENTLHTGPTGNAGAFGTIRVTTPDCTPTPLLDCASLFTLEDAITESGGDPEGIWNNPHDWSAFSDVIGPWVEATAGYLAQAMLSACSVIDFGAVIIDGNMPADIRQSLVNATRAVLDGQDMQGIRPFELTAGTLGRNAQVMGGASLPIMAKYLVDNTVLFKDPVQSGADGGTRTHTP